MTREEAIECIDNLIICIKEHPVVADWFVEIADRKTESDSEKPNNCKVECEKCKYFREEADTYMKQCEFYFMECHYEPKTELFDKGINVLNKTEIPCNSCANKGDYNDECSNCFADSEPIRWKTLSRYKPKVEPQTDTDFTMTYTCCFCDCENFKHFGFGEKCIECKRKQKMWKTEPRTMYYPQVDGITPSVIVPQTDKENE